MLARKAPYWTSLFVPGSVPQTQRNFDVHQPAVQPFREGQLDELVDEVKVDPIERTSSRPGSQSEQGAAGLRRRGDEVDAVSRPRFALEDERAEAASAISMSADDLIWRRNGHSSMREAGRSSAAVKGKVERRTERSLSRFASVQRCNAVLPSLQEAAHRCRGRRELEDQKRRPDKVQRGHERRRCREMQSLAQRGSHSQRRSFLSRGQLDEASVVRH